MSLVAAVEPDPDQASKVAAIVRERVGAELAIGDSARGVFTDLGDRVPDLILTSALLPAADEALIADRLRQLGARAVHARTLTIPVLAPLEPPSQKRGMFSVFRRSPPPPPGCPPDTFADQVRHYLQEASADRERLRVRENARQNAENEAEFPASRR